MKVKKSRSRRLAGGGQADTGGHRYWGAGDKKRFALGQAFYNFMVEELRLADLIKRRRGEGGK